MYIYIQPKPSFLSIFIRDVRSHRELQGCNAPHWHQKHLFQRSNHRPSFPRGRCGTHWRLKDHLGSRQLECAGKLMAHSRGGTY